MNPLKVCPSDNKTPFCPFGPSAPDTLYGHRACTVVISFNGGSEFRLFMTTGRAPDVARGPRALKDGHSAANKSPPELRETAVQVSDGFPER